MSEPKRYGIDPKYCSIEEFEDGQYVSYSDYARLKAEVEAWKDMVADSGVACNERARENQDLENQIERLKAEVESLEEIVGSDAIDRKYGMCCDSSNQAIRLSAEVCRLKAEVERLTAFTTRTIIPNEELQAQVKRLTKAGDAFVLLLEDEGYDMESIREVEAWLAAKEGKPRA